MDKTDPRGQSEKQKYFRIENNNDYFLMQASIRRELNEFKSQEMEVMPSFKFELRNDNWKLPGA